MADPSTLGVDDVLAVLTATQAVANERDLRVCVAVVDRAGNIAGILRHPDAFLTSTGVAVAKAFTAANFGDKTEVLAERIPPETRADIVSVDSRVTFIRGGLPVRRGSALLGGVGVSGASSQEDAELAAAGLAALSAGDQS